MNRIACGTGIGLGSEEIAATLTTGRNYS